MCFTIPSWVTNVLVLWFDKRISLLLGFLITYTYFFPGRDTVLDDTSRATVWCCFSS